MEHARFRIGMRQLVRGEALSANFFFMPVPVMESGERTLIDKPLPGVRAQIELGSAGSVGPPFDSFPAKYSSQG